MSDAIGLYLNEIGKVALLNAEDERNLSKAIERAVDAALAEGQMTTDIGGMLGTSQVGDWMVTQITKNK